MSNGSANANGKSHEKDEEKVTGEEKGSKEKPIEKSKVEKQLQTAIGFCRRLLDAAFFPDKWEDVNEEFEAIIIDGEDKLGDPGFAVCSLASEVTGTYLSVEAVSKRNHACNVQLEKDLKKYSSEGVAIRTENKALERRVGELEEVSQRRKEKYEKARAKKVEMWDRIKELEPMVKDIKTFEKRALAADKQVEEYKRGDELLKEKLAETEERLEEATKAAQEKAKEAMRLEIRLKKADKTISSLTITGKKEEPKKAATKKSATKKPATKKPAAKKPAAKKAASKKAPPKKKEVSDEK